ncbi:MAG: sugar-binding protein [Candidatus Latescibacterota bacterium]
MDTPTNRPRVLLLAVALVALALPATGVPGIQHIDTAVLPTIDGNLSDWSAIPSRPLAQSWFTSTVGAVTGAVPLADQQVEVWLGWNDDTDLIYLAARVRDDVYGVASPGEPLSVFQGDNIEVFIDADDSGGYYGADDAHAQQYGLSASGTLGAVLAPLMMTQPPLVQAAVVRLGNTYSYEMAIPGWNLINPDGTGTRHDFRRNQTIGLAVAFADFESAAAAAEWDYHAYNGLNGLEGAYQDADQFTQFRLVKSGLVVSANRAGGRAAGRAAKPLVEAVSWGQLKDLAAGAIGPDD